MPGMPRPDKDELTDRIMRVKFGQLHNWNKPVIRDLVGPYDPSVFDRYESSLQKSFGKARKKIGSFSDAELYGNFKVNGAASDGFARDWKNFLYLEVSNLGRSAPHWFFGGFGNEQHKAEYSYWSRVESFTLDEATALSIGFSPKSFDEKIFKEIFEKSEKFRHIPEFYFDRREQIDRKFHLSYHATKVSFKDLLNWILQIDLDVPDEMLSSFKRIASRTGDKKGPGTPNKFDHREKASLAQLITALAISELGYAPGEKRSPIPKEIQDICAKLGLEVSDDTIRKYLKLGASYLPEGWQND